MAKTIKFNLICDGNSVRTLEDLRNNFSIEDVLEYYKSGLLLRWLKVRGFDEEYEKVKGIEESDDISIIKKLIDIFGMEIEENQAEESIYILNYMKKRKILFDEYNDSNSNLESIMDRQIQEYNSLVNCIIINKNDMSKIRVSLKEISEHYYSIFELDYRNLFYKLQSYAPKAVFAMFGMDKFREKYLSLDLEKIENEIPTDEKSYLYINRIENDRQDMKNCMEENIKMLEFILGDDLKIFKNSTEGNWKNIEPKGKKFMVLDLDGLVSVRAAGDSEQIITNSDIISYFGEYTKRFAILDGIDYKSRTDGRRLLYMEV